MYDAVHAEDATDADGDGEPALVGLVPNLVAAYPEDPDDPVDIEGTEALDYLYNRLMLNATVRGEVDRDLDRVVEEVDPELAGRMDFIGVNYYTKLTVMGLEAPLFADYPGSTFYPVGSFWQNYPQGLREVLNLAAEYGLPVVVTENGTPDPDGEEGARSLIRHIQALRDAIGDGVDLRGYLYWSLVDNYEWNHGMAMTFGLYEVPPDDASKPRAARLVADLYSQVVQANAIPGDLEATYGE
jgi:beta-galactosidase